VDKKITMMAALLALAGSAAAEVAETYQVEAGRQPGLASKVAIDIISHGTDSLGVWLATGKGVSYTFDDGDHWFTNNTANGLPAENLSALFSVGGRVWVASNHNEVIQDQLMTLSDGLSYSDDDGDTWTTIDFGPNGLNIPYVIGGDRTIFDITGHADFGFFNNRPSDNDAHWLFASAFAGGLLASQDGGLHWRRIFPSPMDSLQYYYTGEAPSLRNRYFSCVADTSHGDSLFLWAGTAAGVFQYVFAPPRDKLLSRWINRIVFCDTCSANGGARLFIGGESGLSLGSAAGGPITSRFELDGLPGPEVTALVSIGGRLLAGTYDPSPGGAGRLGLSTDQGESFSEVSGPWVPGPGRIVSDFATKDGRVYATVEQTGLFVSSDSGQTWSAVPLDTLYGEVTLQVANAVAVLEDTLFVGTDSGLVTLGLDVNGDIISAVHEPFFDSDSTSAKIVRIRTQRFENEITPGTYDSTVLWTIHRDGGSGGVPMVGRRDVSGQWLHLRREITVYDVNFFSDTVFAVGTNGIWFSPYGGEPTNFFSARQYLFDDPDTTVVDNLDQDTVTVMEVRADTVIFGCSDGLAISRNRGRTFRIHRANTDTLSADFVVSHSYLSSLGGLAGDFIPTLGAQYRDGGPARIWVGARPAEMGGQGISVGEYDSTGVMRWQTVYVNDFAWNFEFAGDTVFAAATSGLLMNDGLLDSLNTVWSTVGFTDQATGEVLVAPGTGVYGVGLAGEYLWVGTDDGTVRIDRGNLTSQRLFLRVDLSTPADEVYAFPVPFRPSQGEEVDFHFVVDAAGNVSVKIYDFAMNLVATPIDNVYYPAGVYPSEGSQGRTWDGYNDKGDVVAVGVYYFKVELGSGETRWGKLAVIP